MYRYIFRESCSQFDSLPLTYLTIPLDQVDPRKQQILAAAATHAAQLAARSTQRDRREAARGARQCAIEADFAEHSHIRWISLIPRKLNQHSAGFASGHNALEYNWNAWRQYRVDLKSHPTSTGALQLMELRSAHRSREEHIEIVKEGKAHVIAAVQQNFHSVVAPAARQAYASQGLDDANAAGASAAGGPLAGVAQQGALPQDGAPPGAPTGSFGGVPQMLPGFAGAMAGMEGLVFPGMPGMPPGFTGMPGMPGMPGMDPSAFAQMQAQMQAQQQAQQQQAQQQQQA